MVHHACPSLMTSDLGECMVGRDGGSELKQHLNTLLLLGFVELDDTSCYVTV